MTSPAILFAPGAGKPSSSDWMVAWATALGTLGPVAPFDYPYQQRGRGGPDRMPVLVAHHAAQLAALREAHPDSRMVLMGKSMGSRVGCHVSLEHPVDALVCFGYPLAGGGNPDKLRDQVLRDLSTPILFVQGTRDKLCPLPLLADVRDQMKAASELHVVQTGDHSLQVTKTHTKQTGRTQEDEDADVLSAIHAFLRRHLGDDSGREQEPT
ncbi:MAG: dienelactone hydrolase family protein [Myxococcales bacterium]|nr:dienelactone hydrolase family protein [Myxococcales bacterium]